MFVVIEEHEDGWVAIVMENSVANDLQCKSTERRFRRGFPNGHVATNRRYASIPSPHWLDRNPQYIETREKLLQIRNKRPSPIIDKKILDSLKFEVYSINIYL